MVDAPPRGACRELETGAGAPAFEQHRTIEVIMIPQLKNAKYLDGYRLWLEFADGTQGEIDLEDQLYGEIFEPIREPEKFRQFHVHTEFNTLTWPNGADFAPEYLYKAVSA